MKIVNNLKIESEMAVTSGDATVNLHCDKLTPEIMGMALLHGLKQKVADASAGAAKAAMGDAYDNATKAQRKAWAEKNASKVTEMRAALMQAVVDQLEAGSWGRERSASVAADPLDEFRLHVMRAQLKKNDALRAAYNAVDGDTPAKKSRARAAFLLEKAKVNAAVIDPIAQKMADDAAGIDLDLA